MGSAVLGVILDSSVAIEAEPQQLNVARFLKQIVQKIGEREAALSAITVAELVHGIYRANTVERRDRRRAFLVELKATVPVYPITDNTAELAGKIGGESAAKGVTIPFDDLPIGTCALERGYAVATGISTTFRKCPASRSCNCSRPLLSLSTFHSGPRHHAFGVVRRGATSSPPIPLCRPTPGA
jgi:tRNA(fMet)-specific endonuclease VapC